MMGLSGHGKGLPCSFSVGKEFTIVCTLPYAIPFATPRSSRETTARIDAPSTPRRYDGPTMEEIQKSEAEAQRYRDTLERAERAKKKREEEIERMRDAEKARQALATAQKLRPLCDITDLNCVGFESDLIDPQRCREGGEKLQKHNTPNPRFVKQAGAEEGADAEDPAKKQ